MAPPIHLGARSMALMLWLPFELLSCGSQIWATFCRDSLIHCTFLITFEFEVECVPSSVCERDFADVVSVCVLVGVDS